MQRHRQIAAAPRRPASHTWATISQLVGATLDRSPSISATDVDVAMQAAAPIGMMLVAGGHFDRYPLVIVADSIHLSITTVSGQAAIGLDENLEPVPGGASATGWTVYLPTPDPIGDAVRAAVADQSHLSADEPPVDAENKSASTSAEVVDLDALARREGNR